jgi:hypothetical protein
MTDTDVTFLSCYNIVRHTRMHVMTLYLPSIPATLQALGRVEYATTQSHLLIQGSPFLSSLP